uniref:NADH dehydrogenase [ubiquinone] 1 subunit C2 n=2 Tax=Meloidogyne incognita group TaxID=654580 RepID=A0A915LRS1_MELJA
MVFNGQHVKISPEEFKRRETYLTEGQIKYNIFDPFSWPLPYKLTLASGLAGITSCSYYNIFYRKPWYQAIVVKSLLISGGMCLAYFAGKSRVYNMATRDAVIEHYMELHPDDFERTSDYIGRPYSELLMPWFPRRGAYPRKEKSEYDHPE